MSVLLIIAGLAAIAFLALMGRAVILASLARLAEIVCFTALLAYFIYVLK
jgi:hypothetical protein